MKGLLFVFLVLGLIGCREKRMKPVLNHKLNQDSLFRLREDSTETILMRQFDSVSKITDSLCGLPGIDKYDNTVFRYRYTVFYGNITFVCVAVVLNDSSCQLISKCIIRGTGKFFQRDLKADMKMVATPYDTLTVHTIVQPLSKKDWTTFRSIINGSYYWTFEDPMPNDGILDGDFLNLTSKSRWPRHYLNNWEPDSLRYHYNYVHCPFKGNFTDAYHFLYQKSALLQRCGPMADVNSRFR